MSEDSGIHVVWLSGTLILSEGLRMKLSDYLKAWKALVHLRNTVNLYFWLYDSPIVWGTLVHKLFVGLMIWEVLWTCTSGHLIVWLSEEHWCTSCLIVWWSGRCCEPVLLAIWLFDCLGDIGTQVVWWSDSLFILERLAHKLSDGLMIWETL